PITIGTIGTPGSRYAMNGSCISRECSRPCASRFSTTSGDTALIACASFSSTCTGPNGVCHAPRGQIHTPLKLTKCDGPTSNAALYGLALTALYANAATGPEYLRPACGATIASGAGTSSASARAT